MIDFFTKQERTVIIFLLCGILIGAGVKLYNSKFIANTDSFQGEKERLNELEIRIKEKASLIDSNLAADNLLLAKSQLSSTSNLNLIININTANVEELTNLPKVGPVLAERIVEYRNINGLFKNIDEIKKVKGIGDKKLASIKPHITIK